MSRGWRSECFATAAVLALAIAGTAWARAAATVTRSTDLANRCYAIASAATGGFVAINGPHSYRAVAPRTRATAFYLKPTGLGTYLVFDQDGLLMSVDTSGGSLNVGRAGTPDASTEWAIAPVARRGFTLTSTADGHRLAVSTDGSEALTLAGSGYSGASRLFSFTPAARCLPYPEAQVGAVGKPFAGTDRAGNVFGFTDLHVHITADMRAGGSVIYGESFDRFGITRALSAEGDAATHGPNGVLDVTGNLIRNGSANGMHDNHGWPTFKGWPVHDTITHQQVYYAWLKRAWMAGMRLIVAQTVEDQALCEIEPRRVRSCDELQSIEGQVQRLHDMQDYIDAQSGGRGRGWFRLVYDPGQARRAIAQGKLAVVIGVESSDPFGCSEFLGQAQCTQADIDRGLDEFYRLGVRTMFPLHWVDNAFGGAALETGAQGTFINVLNVHQTGQPFSTEPCTQPGEVEATRSADPAGLLTRRWIDFAHARATLPGVSVPGTGPQCNARGLTDLGAYLIRRMIARHMMIEADHMSEKTRDAVLAIIAAAHYPVVSSHNGTGGSWSPSQLSTLYGAGGMVAVTPDTASPLAAKILALQRYAGPRRYFGVGIGTDTGGLGGQPGPRANAAAHPLTYPFRSYDGRVQFVRERSGDIVYDLNKDGVAHYGLIADLVADIQQGSGDARALPPLFRSAEAYLQTWQLAFSHR